MSALIKIPPKYKYLGVPQEFHKYLQATTDSMGVRVIARSATLLNGQSAGETVQEIKMNQLASITPAIPILTSKYTVLLGYNPKLAELGTVSCPPVLEPGQDINLTIKAYKNFALEDLDYVFTIYLLD